MIASFRARLHFWWQRQLCRWRHDYEPIRVDGDRVGLECFYCGRGKDSHLPARGER